MATYHIVTKKQAMDTASGSEMLDLTGKDFKLAFTNVVRERKETMIKEVKGEKRKEGIK